MLLAIPIAGRDEPETRGDRMRNLLRIPDGVGHEARLVCGERLEDLELRGEQRGRHVAVLPGGGAMLQLVRRSTELHEHDRRMPVPQRVAVPALQGRAGDDGVTA